MQIEPKCHATPHYNTYQQDNGLLIYFHYIHYYVHEQQLFNFHHYFDNKFSSSFFYSKRMSEWERKGARARETDGGGTYKNFQFTCNKNYLINDDCARNHHAIYLYFIFSHAVPVLSLDISHTHSISVVKSISSYSLS